MISDTDFEKAVKLVNTSSNVLITTHSRPDGDACGCVVAMHDTLTALGKNAKILMLSPIPQWYQFIFAQKASVLGEDISSEQLRAERLGEFDLIIIVDTNSHSQLDEFDEYLKQVGKPVLVIDHHVTSDGLGDIELIDSAAAATGLIILDLLKFAGWPVTKRIAETLFVAISTDTGWFQFRNTDSRVYRGCAELIEIGAEPVKLYEKLYKNFSYPRFKLMTAMLNTLELHLDDQYASQHILLSDFDRTGAMYEDTENLINECHRIKTVKVSALFIQLKDGRIRCSLRSKGAINVNEIAAKFGGGGHKMAAGAYLPGPVENAKQIILDLVAEKLS